MTVAEFVELRYVPEHLASVGPAGHDFFHAILKHVLTPEQVDRTLGADNERSRSKLKTIPGWPYLDSHRLCDINTEHIQRIIGAAQEHGYSTQTVTHIRNVIRKVLCHALSVGCLRGETPAARAVLPRIDSKQSHVLSVEQLRQVIHNMQQAEREIALLCILTGMRFLRAASFRALGCL
jgi:site-specific recombinase XerD